MKFQLLKITFLLLCFGEANAQLFDWFSGNKATPPKEMLLTNREIQIQTTEAINNMYNYNFYEAERGFKWLTVKYPDHPIGYFLVGLNTWWKIVPDTKVEIFDDKCHAQMDIAIDKAEEMLDMPAVKKEAAFFLSASYAFKGRLYSEREKWVKAAWAGKQALKYLEISRGDGDINPELIFGDGLYNYYSKWIPENYPSLKPLLTFFRKGNKQQGIKQLEEVSLNAFYTRMEARYFLVQIYAMEGQSAKGLSMARMMHNLYPNNSFFHRYVARMAFSLGQIKEAETYALELLDRIEKNNYGYGSNDGRYACYILGYANQHYNRDLEKAKIYYQKTIDYAITNDSKESGYFLGSHLALGKLAEIDKKYDVAATHYLEVFKNAEKKSGMKTEAATLIKSLKAKSKKAKK
jgi:tetratricopeptide (TPR) repeat protein